MYNPIIIENVLEAMTDQVAILDENGTIVHVNRAWRDFCTENDGDSDTFYIGRNYLDICAVAGEMEDPLSLTAREGISSVIHNGQPFRVEYPCDSPTEERWFEMTATPLDLSADARGALVQHRNISRRAVSQKSVNDAFLAQELLSAVIATSPDAILTYDLDGRIATWNAGAQALYGYTAEEVIGQRLSILYPPDWPTPVSEYRDRILAGELSRFDATRRAKSGELKEVSISAAAVRHPTGDVVAISNIHRDVTDLRRAEEARQIVAREAAHRSKNILSVVRAIERQTASRAESLEDFREAFSARLDSLVSSNDLLVKGEWSAVPLEDLVRGQIDIFLDTGHDKVTLDGPAVQLGATAVQAVGMAIHELATNSTKYGSLDRGEGKVRITWTPQGVGSDVPLLLHWHETGTSFDSPPAETGFGHVVLTRLTQATLETEATLSYGNDGLHWRIAIPSTAYTLV